MSKRLSEAEMPYVLCKPHKSLKVSEKHLL